MRTIKWRGSKRNFVVDFIQFAAAKEHNTTIPILDAHA